MAIQFQVSKSTPTKTRLVQALPRIDLSIDAFGFKISWKQAPFVETIVAMRKLKKGLVEVSRLQLEEIGMLKSSKKAKNPSRRSRKA
jgi:hypothetical protein